MSQPCRKFDMIIDKPKIVLSAQIHVRMSPALKTQIKDAQINISEIVREIMDPKLINVLKENKLDVPATIRALHTTFIQALKEHIDKKKKLPKKLHLNLYLE